MTGRLHAVGVPTAPRLFGVVLAAGEGRRMGRPKAELAIGGRTLLDHHACRMHEAGCDAVALVVRPPAELPVRPRAIIVPAITASPAESLAAALRTLDAEHRLVARDRILVTPVDLYPPSAATLGALVAAIRTGVDCATPVFRRRSGHPVVVTFALVADHVDTTPAPLRDLVREAEARGARVRVGVADAAVLGDWDTPTDWERARRRYCAAT